MGRPYVIKLMCNEAKTTCLTWFERNALRESVLRDVMADPMIQMQAMLDEALGKEDNSNLLLWVRRQTLGGINNFLSNVPLASLKVRLPLPSTCSVSDS